MGISQLQPCHSECELSIYSLSPLMFTAFTFKKKYAHATVEDELSIFLWIKGQIMPLAPLGTLLWI